MNAFWHRLAVAGLMACGLMLCVLAALQLRHVGHAPAGWMQLALGLLLLVTAIASYDVRRPFAVLGLLGVCSLTGAGLFFAGGWSLAGVGLLVVTVVALLADLLTRPATIVRSLHDFYETAVALRRVRRNPAQEAVIHRMDLLLKAQARHENRRHLPWAMLLRAPQGVYLWGSVGRGKTFLLDAMFDVAQTPRKVRLHLHELMARLNALVNSGYTVRQAAAELVPRHALVVVDEVNIADTASALLFAQTVLDWWRRGCVVSFSSNQAPGQLFPDDARQHAAVRRFEARLERACEVIELAGAVDYRLQKLSGADLYQSPVTPETRGRLARVLEAVSEGPATQEPIALGDRPLPVQARADGAAWLEFEALCGAPFSYNDYLRLVKHFPTLLVANVPRLETLDRARRFAWLVEIMYDSKKRLIVSAHVPVHELFAADLIQAGSVDFLKIQSRLVEMQSSEYDYSLT